MLLYLIILIIPTLFLIYHKKIIIIIILKSIKTLNLINTYFVYIVKIYILVYYYNVFYPKKQINK